MKLAIIVAALLLPFSAAQAQMSSIANPGTAPPPSAAPSPAPAQTGAKQKQPRRVAKSNKTVEELFEACMARHQARQRGGKNVGENCRRHAQERGR